MSVVSGMAAAQPAGLRKLKRRVGAKDAVRKMMHAFVDDLRPNAVCACVGARKHLASNGCNSSQRNADYRKESKARDGT